MKTHWIILILLLLSPFTAWGQVVHDGTPAENRCGTATNSCTVSIPGDASVKDQAFLQCNASTATAITWTTPTAAAGDSNVWTIVPNSTQSATNPQSIAYEKVLENGDLNGATVNCAYTGTASSITDAVWTLAGGLTSGELTDVNHTQHNASGTTLACQDSGVTPTHSTDYMLFLCGASNAVTYSAWTNTNSLAVSQWATAQGTGAATVQLSGTSATGTSKATVSSSAATEGTTITILQGTPIPTATPTPTGPGEFPTGVLCLGNVEGNSNCTTSPPLRNSYVDGVSLRYRWYVMEPSDGTYNWTELDTDLGLIAHVGKIASLMIIGASQGGPCWLVNEGVSVYNSYPTFLANCLANPTERLTDADTANPIAAATTIITPWDPTYLSKWGTFLTALSAHLTAAGEMGIVKGVTVTGVNRDGGETDLPNPTDTAGWTAVGYSFASMESAFQTVLNDWATAFPNQALIVRFVQNSWPTGFSPTQCPDVSSIVRDLSDFTFSLYPTRYIMGYNGLDNTTYGNWLPQMCPIGGSSSGAGQWTDCNNSALSCLPGLDLNQWHGPNNISYYSWEGIQDLSTTLGDGQAATMLANIKTLTTHTIFWEPYPNYFTTANATAFTNAHNYLTGQSLWQNSGLSNNSSGAWH